MSHVDEGESPFQGREEPRAGDKGLRIKDQGRKYDYSQLNLWIQLTTDEKYY
jgi:hypothetical protein